jgi:monoamine oxidase
MMIQYPSNPDLVVIGAGAAGIGAGLALARAQVPFIVLEAKERIGGRAYSDTTSLGYLWDHGCHWFHSADKNVLRSLADKLGHAYRKPPRPPLAQRYVGGEWMSNPFDGDFVWDLLGAVAQAGQNGRDSPASELLDRGHPWYPLIHHWINLMYSVEPAQVSTLDAGRYLDTHVNLPVADGYGALIAKLATGLPIKTGIVVERITVGADHVSVNTSAGYIAAKAAIVAIPARMFETGILGVSPALPSSLQQAFHDVPMGWYEKIAIAFDRPVFEGLAVPYADIFDPVSPATRPLNFELHPFGRPIAVTHIAGDLARDMERQGEPDMIGLALDTLVRAFGSDLRKRVAKAATTHWSSDPYINGAYSCAKPGRADARKSFAEPLHDRIFLAGEHVHQSAMATAHGAYESGIAAAHKALKAIGLSGAEPDPLWLPGKQMDMGGGPTYMTSQGV